LEEGGIVVDEWVHVINCVQIIMLLVLFNIINDGVEAHLVFSIHNVKRLFPCILLVRINELSLIEKPRFQRRNNLHHEFLIFYIMVAVKCMFATRLEILDAEVPFKFFVKPLVQKAPH